MNSKRLFATRIMVNCSEVDDVPDLIETDLVIDLHVINTIRRKIGEGDEPDPSRCIVDLGHCEMTLLSPYEEVVERWTQWFNSHVAYSTFN